MLTQAQSKPPNADAPTVCRKLRISYLADYDAITIEHFDQKGQLLSECRLEPEEAADYARSIMEVFDEALGVQ